MLTDPTRRQWIFGTVASTALAAIAQAQEHAHHAVRTPSGVAFEFFDAAAAADVAALAAQILPSDDGPGATEAGVVYFIDYALHTFDAGKQKQYLHGLAKIRDVRQKMFPQSESIASLSTDQQIQLLRGVDHLEFFDVLRQHTVLGFLGSPAYHGNRNKVGWTYIGFDDRMAFLPPFGYYDSPAAEQK